MRPTLDNQSYWTKTEAQLRYILKDAREAADAMSTIPGADVGKYMDQINDACTVLNHRAKGGR